MVINMFKSVNLFLPNVSVSWWCDDTRMLNYRKPRNEDAYSEMMDKRRPESQTADLSEREKQLVEKEQELRRMQEMIAKMQAEMNQKNTPQKMQQNGEVKSQNV